jgi:hypothetical protein
MTHHDDFDTEESVKKWSFQKTATCDNSEEEDQ